MTPLLIINFKGQAVSTEQTQAPELIPLAAENRPTAAVYVTGGVPDYMKSFFGKYLSTALINGGAEVTEESSAAFLSMVGEEQSKRGADADALNDSLICELGRKAGLRYVCAASITPVPGAFRLSARVISTKTGKSRFDAEVSEPLTIMDDLERASGTLAKKMYGGKRVFTAPTAPPPTVSINSTAGINTAVSTNAAATDTAAGINTAVRTNVTATDTATVVTQKTEDAVVIVPDSAAADTSAIIARLTEDAPEPAADTAAAPDVKPNIAVYVTGDYHDNGKKALGTQILASLVNSGRYNGIERAESFLAEIDREQATQRSGSVDDSQISQVGRQFGVKFVCIADITPALGEFQVSARIVNIETAEVAFIGQAASPLETIHDLAAVSDKVVRKMFNQPEPPEADSLFRKPIIEISIGAGGLIAGGYGGGVAWRGGERIKMPYSATGVYLSLDAVYAEMFFGYSAGSGKWESQNAPSPQDLPNMPRAYINVGVFAKYPFEFYKRVKLFPLVGLDYEASISGRLKYASGREYVFDGANNHPDASALSSLWFKLGGGMDFAMGKTLYLRSELIYGLRAANTFEHFCVDNSPSPVWAEFGQGIDLKIGVGAKF